MNDDKKIVGGWQNVIPPSKSNTLASSTENRGFRNPVIISAAKISRANVCYINSLMQGLLHCKSFIAWLENTVARHNHVDVGEQCATCGVYDALQTLLERQNPSKYPRIYRKNTRMAGIAFYCNTVSHQFQVGQQSDCAEFFSSLIERLGQEEGVACGSVNSSSIQREPVNDAELQLFSYKVIEEIKCLECDHGRTKIEQLTSPINLAVDGIFSITGALQKRFMYEINPELKMECPSSTCRNRRTPFVRWEYLLKAPDILTLQPHGSYSNPNVYFDFSTTLELGEKIIYKKPRNVKIKYKLRGVIYRPTNGNNYSGHYYAAVEQRGQWIRKNDDAVTILQDDPRTTGTYMLVYEREWI